MASPKIALRGREIILLSGYARADAKDKTETGRVLIDAEDKLKQAAKRDPDAVAFGYIAGQWIAAA